MSGKQFMQQLSCKTRDDHPLAGNCHRSVVFDELKVNRIFLTQS